MKIVNILNYNSQQVVIRRFDNKSNDFIEVRRVIRDKEVEYFKMDNNVIECIIHHKHRILFKTKLKVIDDQLEIECEEENKRCSVLSKNLLCSHILTLWMLNKQPKYRVRLNGDLNAIQCDYQDGITLIDELYSEFYHKLFSEEYGNYGEMDYINRKWMNRGFLRFPFNFLHTFHYISKDIILNRKSISNIRLIQNFSALHKQFSELDNAFKYGLYLLLSSGSFKEKNFEEFYTKLLIQLNYDNSDKTFLQLKNFEHVFASMGSIRIESLNYEKFLHLNYKNFIKELREIKLPDNLKPKPPIIDIIFLINLIITKLISLKSVFTKKGEISTKIIKKLLEIIPNYVSYNLVNKQYSFILLFVIQLLFHCDFIIINSDSGIDINPNYFEYLTYKNTDKIKYIRQKYLSFIESGKFNIKSADSSVDKEVVVSYYSRQFYKVLNDLLLKNKNSLNNHILHSEIVYSFFKVFIERNRDNLFYDGNISFEFLTLSKDNTPTIKELDLIFRDYHDLLFNYLQFNLNVTGICTPLIDDSDRIIAYKINNYNTDKIKPVKGNKIDLTIMADLTIKIDSSSMNKKQIKWIFDFTEIVLLDNYVESKLTKNKLWKYLDMGNTTNSFIDFLKQLSKNDIPDNVLIMLRGWGSQHGFVNVIEGVTITLPIPEIIDQILKIKSFSKITIVRLSPTIIVVPNNHAKRFINYLEKKNHVIHKILK